MSVQSTVRFRVSVRMSELVSLASVSSRTEEPIADRERAGQTKLDPIQGGAAIAKPIVTVRLEKRFREADNPPVDAPKQIRTGPVDSEPRTRQLCASVFDRYRFYPLRTGNPTNVIAPTVTCTGRERINIFLINNHDVYGKQS